MKHQLCQSNAEIPAERDSARAEPGGEPEMDKFFNSAFRTHLLLTFGCELVKAEIVSRESVIYPADNFGFEYFTAGYQ